MTTRQNTPFIEDKEQLPTGYDTQGNDPSTYSIPSCGIEDVDVALHSLFDTEIPFKPYQANTGYQKEINLKKPFVVFATGEKFALAKRLKPFRDRNGVLLLPAISIRRTNIEQAHNDTFFGEMTIKRRFDASDKDYQSLINRLALANTPTPPDTLRSNKGENAKEPESIREGMLLDMRPEKLKADHIYEIISIPFPQFYTATYEIVLWTNYIQHMNYMIETIMANQITPGRGFHLKTEKGYWFAATMDTTLTAQDNFDDTSDTEKLVKYTFNIAVRGYLLAPQGTGQRVPFKRYLTTVNMGFETFVAPGDAFETPPIDRYAETKIDPTTTNPYILSDIEEDPQTKQKQTSQEKIIFQRSYRDPSSQTQQTKYVKQMANNQKKGETVYTASDQQALFDFFVDNK